MHFSRIKGSYMATRLLWKRVGIVKFGHVANERK